jgi:putative toxin-antitoxin system antitoxin component (TIGR02293 family)
VPNTSGPAAVIALIGQARAGLAASSLRELGQRLELAMLLGTTERTLARRFHINDKLTKAESERLLLLQRLVVHGVDVFEDQDKFNRWLRRPLPLLDGQSPLQLLDTASGFQVVDELLGRIEYVVYS